ncbi:hypothetical protein RHA1_ro04022 [Rhodococcus jostii RHA1]|uniref:Uncharacterized protein n=1 Tax=Rhodococcus jostii (strain RHA1) TaxID=101510 RepID=Q0S9G7_RHOJR|nr:hypothetical protein RHA1_ro04022 [Rhodococcus jostii RHA1]
MEPNRAGLRQIKCRGIFARHRWGRRRPVRSSRVASRAIRTGGVIPGRAVGHRVRLFTELRCQIHPPLWTVHPKLSTIPDSHAL